MPFQDNSRITCIVSREAPHRKVMPLVDGCQPSYMIGVAYLGGRQSSGQSVDAKAPAAGRKVHQNGVNASGQGGVIVRVVRGGDDPAMGDLLSVEPLKVSAIVGEDSPSKDMSPGQNAGVGSSSSSILLYR
jgi:hypothetical protein